MQMAYDGDGYGGPFGGVEERNASGRLAVAWPAENLEHGLIAKRLRRAWDVNCSALPNHRLLVSSCICSSSVSSNKP